MGAIRASRPSRARGLKSDLSGATEKKQIVAPLAGAWIEIQSLSYPNSFTESRPSRARGLK